MKRWGIVERCRSNNGKERQEREVGILDHGRLAGRGEGRDALTAEAGGSNIGQGGSSDGVLCNCQEAALSMDCLGTYWLTSLRLLKLDLTYWRRSGDSLNKRDCALEFEE